MDKETGSNDAKGGNLADVGNNDASDSGQHATGIDTYPNVKFPLDNGRYCKFSYPGNMTKQEAAKLGAWISSGDFLHASSNGIGDTANIGQPSISNR
jgi:hypothetical protein